jgi:phosphate transport system substrate-binding protein
VKTSSLRRVALPAAALLTVGLTLTACGDKTDSSSGGGSSSGGTLNGGGSTAQAVAQQTWRAGYQKANSGVTINYEEVGSGTGVENFLNKAYSFAGSDAFLTDDQLTQAKQTCGADAIEVPNYISPLAIIYNLKGVDSLNLSGETAADIFNGTITKWNDSAIAKDNPGVTLPDTAITVVHRSDDSGTTFNFTDYLSQASNGAWTDPASVTWPKNAGGQGLEGTSGVVGGVTDTDGSIGYADDSAAGDLGVANIQVGSSFVAPSAAGASKTLGLSPLESGRPASDMAIKVDRTSTEKGTYPLLLVSYLMACPTYSDASTADLVKGYLTYVLSSEGQQAGAAAAKSAPLPANLSSKATQLVSQISAGS